MIQVIYNTALKKEYQDLFDTCAVDPKRLKQVQMTALRIAHNQSVYSAIADKINSFKNNYPTMPKLPWYVVGLIHNTECGLSFKKHLHNGDPLTARTKRVPAGRPATGNPPFSFQDSAVDALTLLHLDQWSDWSVPGVLYVLERYNGLGYRQYHPTVKTPYLWSMTNHYSKGKYVADGKFDPNAISLQIGCAALLKELI